MLQNISNTYPFRNRTVNRVKCIRVRVTIIREIMFNKLTRTCSQNKCSNIETRISEAAVMQGYAFVAKYFSVIPSVHRTLRKTLYCY